MKNWIKDVFIFATGMMAGASIAWGYLHKKLEKNYNDALAIEVDAITKSMEMRKELKSKREAEALAADISEDDAVELNTKDYTETKSSIVKPAEPSRTQYDKVPPFADPEGEHPMDDDEPKSITGIYIISEEEYYEGSYDHQKIFFNNLTDEFVDENGEMLTDPRLLLGQEAIDYLLFDKSSEGEVFVRNDHTHTDYYLIFEEEM